MVLKPLLPIITITTTFWQWSHYLLLLPHLAMISLLLWYHSGILFESDCNGGAGGAWGQTWRFGGSSWFRCRGCGCISRRRRGRGSITLCCANCYLLEAQREAERETKRERESERGRERERFPSWSVITIHLSMRVCFTLGLLQISCALRWSPWLLTLWRKWSQD